MYSNMNSIGIKIPTQNEGHLQLFDDFTGNRVKTTTVTDFVFQHDKLCDKLCNKLYTMNLDARGISYES